MANDKIPSTSKPGAPKPFVRANGSTSGASPNGVPRRLSDSDDPGPLSMTGINSGMRNSIASKLVLGGIILVFAVPFLLPALTGDNAVDPSTRVPGSGPDVVARVGDEVVARDLFQRSFARQLEFAQQFGQDTSATGLLNIRQSTLSLLAGEAAQVAEAKKRGLAASEEDIDKYITEQIDKSLEPQQGETKASVRRRVEAEHGTEAKYREDQRKNYDRDLVARAVLLKKLEEKVKEENKVTEDDYKRSVTKLNLRQIKLSPKPDPKAKDPKAASEKAAADLKARAAKLAAELKGAPVSKFIAVAKKESDDIATKAKGGELGLKLPSELPLSPDVQKALLAANGTLVGPIEEPTFKDQYIFYVAGRKLELPKDYAKTKAEKLKQFEEQQDATAWNAFTTKLAEANKPQIEDPALAAYDTTQKLGTAPTDQQKALRDQAIAKYEEALNYASESEATAIRFQLAQQYAVAGQPAKQLENLKLAAEGSNDRTVKIEYAQALVGSQKKDEALKLAQQISSDIDKNPSPPPQFSFGGQQGSPDDATRLRVAGLFEQLGKKDLAAKERAKIKPAAPAGGPGGLNLGNVDIGGGNKTITIPPR